MHRLTMFTVALAATTAQSLLAGDDPETSWRGQPGSSLQTWRFDTGSNPIAAEVCHNTAPDRANVTTGDFAIGWQGHLSGLGEATGFWDLGRQGTITTPLPLSLTQPADTVRYILVSICQYQDGGIYSELAGVTIPGATLLRTGVDFAEFSAIGEWTVDQTLWRVDAGVGTGPVTISGAVDGSVVDLVTVEAGAPVSGQAVLAIRRLGAEVEVAWALELEGLVLEATPDLNDPQGWQPVEAPVRVVGQEQLVRLSAANSTRFFRLRKP